MTYLQEPSCPVLNLFMDWNPIYDDEGYQAGDNGSGKPYVCREATEEEEAEQSPFARLVENCKRL
jgi:hypothetical protein